MKNNRTIAVIAAFAVVVALPGAALAQERDTAPTDIVREQERVRDTDRSIEKIKDRAAEAIAKRQATLNRLTEKAIAAPHLTDEHEASLLADYAAASSGLADLGDRIEGATTYEELRELVPLIAADYRVYLVIAPKSYLVAAADHINAGVPRFEEALGKIGAHITRAEEAGWDVAEAVRYLEEAEANLAEAARLAAPVAGNVINLDASDWPNPAEATLKSNREAVRNSHSELKAAKEAAKAAVEALRAAAPNDAVDG